MLFCDWLIAGHLGELWPTESVLRWYIRWELIMDEVTSYQIGLSTQNNGTSTVTLILIDVFANTV